MASPITLRAKQREAVLGSASMQNVLMLTGRQFGKTVTLAYALQLMMRVGKTRRAAVIVPTTGNYIGRVLLPALREVAGERMPSSADGGKILTWPNGGRADVFSGTDPDAIRGSQCDLLVLDEFAHFDQPGPVFDAARHSMRGHDEKLGIRPRWLATSTPPTPARHVRSAPLVRRLLDTADVVIRGRSSENTAVPHDAAVLGVDSMGLSHRIEFEGEFIEKPPDAMFDIEKITRCPASAATPESMERVVVAVDVAVTTGDKSDLTGIIVAGVRGEDVYILNDSSGRYNPKAWASQVIRLYDNYGANEVVVETNQGGDLLVNNLHVAGGGHLRVTEVHATRGKQVRTEPVATLYEQGRVIHANAGQEEFQQYRLKELEDQMLYFSRVAVSPVGDDRVDAMVYAVTHLSPGLAYRGRFEIYSPYG